MVLFLKQVFARAGFVGSICLAGPDPESGGNLMTVSCVQGSYRLELLSMTLFFASSVHQPFANGSTFEDMYPQYSKAIADPMRSYSSLFFRMDFCSSINNYSLCDL